MTSPSTMTRPSLRGWPPGTNPAPTNWTSTGRRKFSQKRWALKGITDPEEDAWRITPTIPPFHSYDTEIGDFEAANYTYRLNGYLVHSYWSNQDNAYIVPDGNQQNFYVSGGVLLVKGGQLGSNYNDNVTVGLTPAGGVQVTLNGETAQFDRRPSPASMSARTEVTRRSWPPTRPARAS